MTLPTTLMFFAALLVIGVLLQPLARRIHLPFALLLVLAGFAGSEAVVALGYDTGLRADSFGDLIFYVFLPVLIFESAFNTNPKALAKDLVIILTVSIPILLLSIAITTVLVYHGIAHAEGFPWIAALMTGALLGATDPGAAEDGLQGRSPKRLTLLLEGESLFNDTTAIVLFGIFVSMALNPLQIATPTDALLRFALLSGGGAAIGLAAGLVFLLLYRWFSDPVEQGLLSIICAYSSFLAADSAEVSGVMAVLIAGLVLGWAHHRSGEKGAEDFVDRVWTLNAFAAKSLVFLLMGVTITPPMFEERWLAMLVGIGGLLIARAAGIFSLLPLAGKLPGTEPIPARMQAALYWGGMRGAVTLALALSLPVELDYWWTIQSIAFGVVLFSLVVQAPTMPLLLRWMAREETHKLAE